jgi:hypothetical protein
MYRIATLRQQRSQGASTATAAGRIDDEGGAHGSGL